MHPVQVFELATLNPGKCERSEREISAGWGGRIRTYGTCYQKALPYRLATPHQRRSDYDEVGSGSSPEIVKIAIPSQHLYGAGHGCRFRCALLGRFW